MSDEAIPRRAFLAMAAAAAVPLPSVAASAGGWPHPTVGRVATAPLELTGGETLAGSIGFADEVHDPGRIYTAAEWAQVKDDVLPWLRARNAALTPTPSTKPA